MSLTNGLTIDNNDLRFVELRKYLVCGQNNGISSIVVDNKGDHIIVLNEKQLVVISFTELLNFVWNKSVINEIKETFDHFSIGLNFNSHLISISAKGFGTKIAVCGTEGQNGLNDSPFIVFFDLNSIYNLKNKSTAYSRINLINSRGVITEICWHPEICDNQFACCVSDGSLFIISIGDLESRTSTILSHLSSSVNAMSLCWSPKGKRIVIGFRNGYFSQYMQKDGQNLQEKVKTVLPDNFKDYSVISIKWISNHLMTIACNKDRDTHVLLVSTQKSIFVDFGSVCFDNFDINDSYRVNLLLYESMIICTTSMATEVSIIGCESGKDISMIENWCLWALDDSSRIELPIDKYGNDTYLRGIAISKGTPNIFKLSASETYGGINCPILWIYNSSGVLLPYLMVDKCGSLNVPHMPTIIKPVMQSVTAQALPNPSTQPSVTVNKQNVVSKPQNQSFPSFGNAFTPVSNSTSLESKSSPKSALQQSLTMNHMSQPLSFTPNTTINQSNLDSIKSTNNSSDKESVGSAINSDDLYIEAIKEQIEEFNAVMNETKKKVSLIKVNIGSKDEELELKKRTRLLEEVLHEIKENFRNCSKDTTTLQSGLIESFSLVEEAKSILDRNSDPKYRNLLKQRALDPITSRRMDEINSLNEYINIQLRELEAKFEQEWYELLQKRKQKSKSDTRVSPNSNYEMVYKALSNNQNVICFLNLQLEKLEGIASPQRVRTPLIKGIKNRRDVDILTKSLDKTSIKEIPFDSFNEKTFRLKTMPKEKKESLRNFLENRPIVPIRRSIEVVNSNSSRFISAIEKLKSKQKNKFKIQTENNRKIAAEVKNVVINQNSEQIVNKTIPQTIKPQLSFQTIGQNVNENKAQIEKPKVLNVNKSDQKPPPPSYSTLSNPTPQTFAMPAKESPKLKFEIKANPFPTMPSFGAENNLIQIPRKTSVETDSKKNDEPVNDHSSNASKTVSFGNTVIINTIESNPDEGSKLDTISECTENNDSLNSTPKTTTASIQKSPFSSFQGFGGMPLNVNSSQPKLSFKLNLNSPSIFSAEGDSHKSELTPDEVQDSSPKFEDITPPNSPQTVPEEQPVIETKRTEKSTAKTTISETTESESSKPMSILKSKLSQPLIQPIDCSIKSPENNSSTGKVDQNQSIKPFSQLTTQPNDTVSAAIPLTSNASIDTTNVPLEKSPIVEPLKNDVSPAKPLFGSQPQINQNTNAPIGSPFSQTTFGQTPFAANSFSFGNVSSNTSTTPSFGQSLSFGGSTGFGQSNSTASNPNSNANTGSLSFGQQTNTLNSLSFCGLGGQPSPENANKNVFGGNFTSNSPQTPQFGSNTQPSLFGSKASSGGSFSGSFSSGGSGVAQTGFGAFQQSPQQTGTAFGGSPTFGSSVSGQQTLFGGSPTFGGPPQQAFGASSTFGGSPPLGSTFAQQTNNAFGANAGFSNKVNDGLSFGALASATQQTQPMFGSQFSFNSTANSLGSNSDQSQAFSFTQRRK